MYLMESELWLDMDVLVSLFVLIIVDIRVLPCDQQFGFHSSKVSLHRPT